MSRPTATPDVSLATLTAEVACATAGPGRLPDMLRRCAEVLARRLPAVLVQVWVPNTAEDALILQAAAPDPGPAGALSAVPILGSVPGRLVRDRRPLVADRVPVDPALPDPAWVRRRRVAAFAGYPLVVEGRAVGALAVFTRQPSADLGPLAPVIAVGVERKRMADRLRQAEAFEAVGRAAAGLAHDLNNLMTLVAAYGDLVRPLLPPDSPAAALTVDLGQVAVRAVGIARRLVALGRPTPTAVLDLNAAVTDLAPLVRRIVGPGINLDVRLAPQVSPVRADRLDLEQILLNLAGNARDAMSAGGTLTIQTGGPQPGGPDPLAQSGRFARLTVADTGVGMDAATRARLFEPYFTTKAAGRGTGLGLANVRAMVGRVGGHVTVESEPGRGTVIHVDLPWADETDAGGQTAAPADSAARPPTVLVTDADAGVRALTRHVLTRHGYAILEAADAPAAIRVAETHPGPIHLLVTDLLLPGMTGRQLADRLAARRPGLRVLYFSGLGTSAAVASQPGSAFLDKPFRPADLARTVAELLSA